MDNAGPVLIRGGLRTMAFGVAANLALASLCLALTVLPVTGNGEMPPPVKAVALSILSTLLGGSALIAEGESREANGIAGRLVARSAAVGLAIASILLLVVACTVLMR